MQLHTSMFTPSPRCKKKEGHLRSFEAVKHCCCCAPQRKTAPCRINIFFQRYLVYWLMLRVMKR